MGSLQIFLYSAVTLIAIFFGGSTALKATADKSVDIKRRQAWIVTACSSIVMSGTGLYFAGRLFMTSGQILLPGIDGEENDTDAALARFVCVFFLAYCAVDAAIAAAGQYAENVNIAYEHHAGYFVLIVYLLYSGRSLLFAVCALEEFPTLILSVYELLGDTSPRLPVGLSIFVFRIFYHLYVTYAAIESSNTMLYFISVYLLLHHVAWFRAWFFKRVAARREQDDRESSGAPKPPPTPKGSSRREHFKTLSLQVESHVYMVAGLGMLQILMHLFLVISELRKISDMSSLLWMGFYGLFHIVAFLSVTVRMAGIVQDIYTEHFIMHAITKKEIIYNISWEDPRVERELLNIGEGDVILTISSAGCNVLDYLCEGPKHIVACDFNAAQLAVLELKLECFKHLTHDETFRIWAESDFECFQKCYKNTLRSKCTKVTQEFWDENESLIKDNFMFAGTSGLAAKMLVPPLRFLGLTKSMLERKLFPPASIGLAIVNQVLSAKWLWPILAPLGGVPKSQLDLVAREPDVWVERVQECIARRMWMKDNYFYYAYIAGKWSPECCPRYLYPENFANLKKYAKEGRVTMHHGPIAAAAQLRDDFTVASLLDSMDWMPDSMIASQMADLIPQMDKKGHIFWRSFATKVHSPVLASLLPDLVPDEDGRERVGWYLTQWIAPVPDQVDYSKLTIAGGEDVPKNTLIDDAMVISAMAIHATKKEKSVKEFYQSQGKNYDGFREMLLPDRNCLLQYCLPWYKCTKGGEAKTWLSVGCGTARDIEYVVNHVKETGTKTYLLDLSPDLLDMAGDRVKKLGLEDLVTLVEADICAAYDKNGKATGDLKGKLPDMGTIDIVTCSYCLTMIPPWKEALEAMIKAVKKGGTLALVDFTKRSDTPEHWTQKLNQWWFANDGVYFDHAHTEMLRNHEDLREVWFHETEGRVPYTPLQATHYLYTGLKK